MQFSSKTYILSFQTPGTFYNAPIDSEGLRQHWGCLVLTQCSLKPSESIRNVTGNHRGAQIQNICSGRKLHLLAPGGLVVLKNDYIHMNRVILPFYHATTFFYIYLYTVIYGLWRCLGALGRPGAVGGTSRDDNKQQCSSCAPHNVVQQLSEPTRGAARSPGEAHG